MKLYRAKWTKVVGGKRIAKKSAKWYVKLKVGGTWKAFPLSPDKRASEIMAARILEQHESKRVGTVDPFAAPSCVPLATHAAEYADHLRQKGSGEQHVGQVERYLTRTFADTGAILTGEVRPTALARHLAGRRKGPDGVSPRRHNWEVGTLRSFFAWMVRAKRVAESPAADLGRVNEQVGRRLVRRPLTEAECDRLILVADASTKIYRGMTGPHRATLYAVALATGFRCGELASLDGRAFNLDGKPPTVTLGTDRSKNGRLAVQPLPDWAVAILLRDTDTLPAGPLFPGTWHEKAAKMIRIDLAAANIPAVVDSPTGKLTVDFHSLRHTYIAGLKRAGVRLDDAVKLARHSDPKLTLAIYGQSSFVELGEAVNRLTACHGLAMQSARKLDNNAQNIRILEVGSESDESGSRPELKVDTLELQVESEVKPVGIEPTTRRLKVFGTSDQITCNSSDNRGGRKAA